MPMYAGVGGAWKQISAPSVGVGSAHKAISGGWVGAGGAWKQFFNSVSGTVDLSFLNGQVFSDSGAPSSGPSVTLFVLSSGQVQVSYDMGATNDVVDEWLTSGTNDGLFEIRFTLISGSLQDGSGTFDSWLTLDSDRSVTSYVAVIGTDAANIGAEIRYNGGDVLTSATFTLSTSAEP